MVFEPGEQFLVMDLDGSVKRYRCQGYGIERMTTDGGFIMPDGGLRQGPQPPQGWQQLGTHANCRPQARIETSAEVGDDGLPLWERVAPPHIYGEETL